GSDQCRMIENGIARFEIAQKIDQRNLIGLRARERTHDEVEIGGREPRPTIRPDHRELIMQGRRRLWQVRLLTAGMLYRNGYLCLEQLGFPAWVANIAIGWKWPSVLIIRPLLITSR